MSDLFYFVTYADDRNALTVVDMQHNVEVERSDYDVVNDKDFDNIDKAISYAKDLASRHQLKYKLFESRYDQSTNESGFIY